MIVVTQAAATTALTTRARVKRELDITSTTNDEWLDETIADVSAAACEVLNVEMAEDGTRNFGVESVTETIDHRTRYPWLPPLGVIRPRREADTWIVLGRRPVLGITSITENGVTVDPSDYELFATTGKVKRLSAGVVAAWPCTIIVVTYTAGWKLPGDSGSVTATAMPASIEKAVIEGVKARYFARKRDANVKSENIPGVRQVDYFFGTPGQDDPLPPLSMSLLNAHRNISL